MPAERIQKILALLGIASRRKAEEIIAEGSVTVNGKVAKLGDKAQLGKDAIKVNGRLLQQSQSLVYIVFNKPKGVISALSDPQGRPTISQYLGAVKTRVFPVGRLDFNTEGLILLTNDGKFAEQVQKRDEIPRVYMVKVKHHPDPEMVSRLEKGVRMGETRRLFRPASIRLSQELTKKAWIEVVIMGGGVFDLKEYFEKKGFLVERILRSAVGHLSLRGVAAGELKYLTSSQAHALIDQPDLGLRKIGLDVENKKQLKVNPKGVIKTKSGQS